MAADARDLYQLIYSLTEEVKFQYAANKTLSDELLSSLRLVFGNHLEAALDLCDRKNVSVVTSPSGTSLYSCLGSTGTPYYVPKCMTFCPCASFKYIVINNTEAPLCKHLIAVRLAIAMDLTQQRQVSNEVMFDIITELGEE